MTTITPKEHSNKLFSKIGKDEITFVKYLIDCCENILGKQVIGVGYPDAQKKYGLIPPILQLAKMKQELKIRLKLLKSAK